MKCSLCKGEIKEATRNFLRRANGESHICMYATFCSPRCAQRYLCVERVS